jgi:hypothetical protein
MNFVVIVKDGKIYKSKAIGKAAGEQKARAKRNAAPGYPSKGKANFNHTRSPFGLVTSSSRCHLRTIAAAGVR